MSQTIAEEHRKRDRPEGGESIAEKSKQRRVEPLVIDGLQQETPPRFLNFHLTVLRSLYPSEDEHTQESDKISTETWSTIERFLNDRVHILHAKQQAASWNGVRVQARRVADKRDTNQMQSTPRRSPFRETVPHLFGPSQTPSKPAHSSTPSNSFPMIARLLEKRADVINTQYAEQKRVYQSVAEGANRRIEELQEHLNALHVDGKNEFTFDNSGNDSRSKRMDELAALQTKIHLWTLFAADLKDVL